MSADQKILLVARESAERDRMVQALDGAGWLTTTAADAVSAQLIARQQQPGVVIVDELPHGEQIRVLQRLRTSISTAFVPAVALTATKAAERELLAAGAQECVTKPVATDALAAAVTRLAGTALAPQTAPGPCHCRA